MSQEKRRKLAADGTGRADSRALAPLVNESPAGTGRHAKRYATSPFLAQLIGNGLAKRRLAAARDAAQDIHASYRRGTSPSPATGRRIDVSI